MTTPKRYAVIVTGSRHWTDYDAICQALWQYPADTVIIHGDCSGADRLARRYAEEVARTHLPMPAPFDTLGRRAGPLRNGWMLAVANILRLCGYTPVVEAFPLPSSKGTWDCVNQAKAVGVEVKVNDA